MRFFLGIDIGTSYFKAGLFDQNGCLRGMGRELVKKTIKDDITCELPVTVFWKILRNCIGEAIRAAGIHARMIISVSYASQANSFILLDASDKPLTPLVLWPDNRADGLDLPGIDNNFQQRTGLGIKPDLQFCVAKLMWFRARQPRIWDRINSIMSISDYLTYGLTGQKISDFSTAAMTGLLDIRNCRWWDKQLDKYNINLSWLSIPQRAGTLVGTLSGERTRYLGLGKTTGYFSGGLDHHMAALGAGIPLWRNISESTGTVLACVSYGENLTSGDHICLAPGLDENQYFQMIFDANGAASLEWYQKNHSPGSSIQELMELAAVVEPGCEGLTARPCAHLYRHLDGFENRYQIHTHGHYVRALLESTAMDLATIMPRLNGYSSAETVVSAGGGARSSLWIRIKADLTGKTFLIPECTESACLGAAMTGAAGSRITGNISETITKWVRVKETVKPDTTNALKYRNRTLNYRFPET